jgi:effector-binding domain-containing protein
MPIHLEHRAAQPYAAVRLKVPIPFGKTLGPAWGEVGAWLSRQGIQPAGAPFIRYLTTDMSTELDLEVGLPVAAAASSEGAITAGVLPAGKYAVLMYAGPYKGKGLFKATVALLEWARQNGLTWKTRTIDQVEWWEGRLEWYLTDPEAEPDPKKWQTELAFLVED